MRPALKMRRSLAELEQEFARETELDRDRRSSLIRASEQRSARRGVDKRNRHGRLRFFALLVTLLLTAVLVTAVMFETLYLLLA
ncbi:MAG TPA: hypothetical protein VMA83_11755 [Solirubrobacteraceae bacterium]|nr:hypothetical protein [Solirubrobacteraceae bacterium]